MYAQALLARVVVDEADRRRPGGRRLQHLLHDHLGRVTGTGDDHLAAASDEALARRALENRAGEHPRAGDEREQQQPVHDRDRPRQPDLLDGRGEVDDEARGEARDRDAAHRRPHVASRDVAPPPVVEAEEDEDRRAARRGRSGASARAASRSTAGSSARRSGGGRRGTTLRRSVPRPPRPARGGGG